MDRMRTGKKKPLYRTGMAGEGKGILSYQQCPVVLA